MKGARLAAVTDHMLRFDLPETFADFARLGADAGFSGVDCVATGRLSRSVVLTP